MSYAEQADSEIATLTTEVERLTKIIDEASARAGQIDEAIDSLLAVEHNTDGLL